MSARRRRPPWLLLIFMAFGVVIVAGGFTVLADQRSGAPGEARVTECTGGRKYEPAIRCRGTWTAGGRVVAGRVEGAGHRDVGKAIEARIHGTDHATKPSLGTPLVLWGLGAPVVALAVVGLVGWWRD